MAYFKGIISAFAWRDCKKPQEFSQNIFNLIEI